MLMFFLMMDGVKSAQSLPPCYIDLPVYDATGKKYTYEISAVTLEGEMSVDFLNIRQTGYRVVARGEKLYFPRDFIGMRRLEITLADKQRGRRIRSRVALMSCQQRSQTPAFKRGVR